MQGDAGVPFFQVKRNFSGHFQSDKSQNRPGKPLDETHLQIIGKIGGESPIQVDCHGLERKKDGKQKEDGKTQQELPQLIFSAGVHVSIFAQFVS